MTEKTTSEIISELYSLAKSHDDLLKSIDFKLNRLLAHKNSENTVQVTAAAPVKATVPLTMDQANAPARPDIVVSQKVGYQDGRGAALASVELYPGAKEYAAGDTPITKTKTNQMGRWTLKVKPGNYQVKIFKHPTSNKSKIDLLYPVEILESPAVQELKEVQGES